MERELVVLTGVSGAGKSTAMGFLEDVGYYLTRCFTRNC